MRKGIIISNLLTLFLLGYYAVIKGLDAVIGVAIIVSLLSNALNIICEVRHGREKD